MKTRALRPQRSAELEQMEPGMDHIDITEHLFSQIFPEKVMLFLVDRMHT